MIAHMIDHTLILGPAQWHCLLQRHTRIPGSSDLSALEYQYENNGFDTELDIVVCAAPFSVAPGFLSGKVANSCYAALSGIASGIHYNPKEHYWILHLIPKIPEQELVLSYFTKRLGVSNSSSSLILLHNQVIHIATSHRV